MKKVILGIFVLVFCLSSFKGMAQEAIPFTEEEGLNFKSELLELIGAKKVVVSTGNYEIKFDEQNPNGYVIFNLEEYDGPSAGITSAKIGIRIAVRERKCGENQFYSHCLCGVGFRCGTTTVQPAGYDDFDMRTNNPHIASTEISINPENKTVIFRFTNPVEWSKLNDN